MTKQNLIKYVLGLVGTKYQPNGLAIVAQLEPDHPIALVREPYNIHDPNAIGVYVQIGYIPAAQAASLSRKMDLPWVAATLKDRRLVEVELEDKKDEQATSSSQA